MLPAATTAIHRTPSLRARRSYWAAFATAALLATAGCMPVMWASPQIDHFLATDLDAPADQVHVFRVDITQRDSGMGYLTGRPGLADGVRENHYHLQHIAVLDDGQVPSQTLFSWQKRSGTYNVMEEFAGLPFYGSHEGHQYLLRYYRPGFQLIEVKPWQNVTRLDWEPALDLVSREKAIDNLVSVESGPEATGVVGTLDPGTVDRHQRDALLFAADEYERLAAQEFSSGPQPEDVRARIRKKGERLRKLANGITTPAVSAETKTPNEADSRSAAKKR